MISRQQHQSLANQQRERPLNGPGLYNGTLYLARRELRRTWRSYIWALIIALIMGVVAAFILGAASGQGTASEHQPSSAVLNLVFVILIAALPRTGAWHSGASGSTGWTVPSNEHLAFLRSLPLTADRIVAARALSSVASVMILCAAFFTPLFSLAGSLRAELGAAGCLLFALFWSGCALAFEAVGLFTELGFFGIAGILSYAVAIFLGGAVAGALGAQETVVSVVSGLVRDHGALPAFVALGGGCGALALSWLATSWRLRKKESR